jgi:hypothetical protein
MAKESYEAMQARMTRAFDLVHPAGHWKNPVHAEVTSGQLEEAGLTIEQVAEAVVHFTGTQATLKMLYPHPNQHGVTFYLVTAPGYYAGPCN